VRPAVPAEPGELSLSATPLRIRFAREGDRVSHCIELYEEGGFRTLLQSCEGTPAEDWPASPPLKELHFEDRPGGRRLALLVGMAGRSHWSASIELIPEVPVAVFDLACRIRLAPQSLGCRYEIAPDVTVEARETGVLLAGRLLLVPDSAGPAAACLDWQGGQLSIRPQPTSSGDPGSKGSPETVRWRFRFQVEAVIQAE
jgi:hypothetical protein